ncbi:MAG TPA: aldehyde dehydrogenase family protein [Methylomirabilota bacterium]|jgi:aldehyde dehydrogenase (NAD+)
MTFQKAIEAIVGRHRQRGGEREVRMLVDGRWVAGEGTRESAVVNPATEQVLAWVRDATPGQIRQAFQAARTAQETWHLGVGEQDKERVFRRVAASLHEIRGPLAWVMIQEGGKLWKWAEAEVQEAIDTVWHYHGETSRMYGRFARCQAPDKLSITMREPCGVILGITPWNFPLAVPSWKIFAALAGGNAIVMKASEQTPTTLSILGYVVQQAITEELGATQAERLAGIFQVLHGRGETVGRAVLEEGDYDKVMFTGGTETGGLVGEIAGRRRKPVSLELGGHAAIILLDDFDLDRAVSEAVVANCGDSGQRCVSLRAVFAQDTVVDEFRRRYVKRIQSLRIGNPGDPTTVMGPLVSAEQLERVESGVARAVAEGGQRVHGGFALKSAPATARAGISAAPEAWARGYFYPPTVIEARDPTNYAMQDEIFGPVLCLSTFSGRQREEALLNAVRLMNDSRYGLSNAVLTNQLDLAMKAMERAKTGILYIGRGTTGAELGKPFGGVRDSGHGREGAGLDEVTYLKQIYIDYHGRPRMAQAGSDDVVQRLLQESRALGEAVFGGG